MARSYSNEYLSTIAANGVANPLPKIRNRSAAAFRHVRTSVLPDLDTAPAAPSEAEERTEPTTGSRLRRTILHRIIPASMVVVLLLILGLVAFRVVYADRVYPAVVVGDVPVGGLTVTEAQARLTERAASLEHGMIIFSYQGQTWTPTLSDLGVTVMLDDSIADARHIGRSGNATSRLAFIGDSLDAEQVIPLQTEIDQGMLNAWFDSVDIDMNQLPVNARVVIDDGVVTIEPGATGIVVDREAATAHLLQALASLEPVAISLPTRVANPAIPAGKLAMVQGDIEKMISKPVVATFDDQEWTIEPETVAPFLDVDVTLESGVPTSHLTVDTDGLARELRTRFSDDVNRKPADAVFGWDDGLVVLEPSVTGAALRSNAFAEAVGDSFLNGHTPVDIPVVTIEPTIDSTRADSYGITTLLGAGHSNFEGGTWERDENVRVATELMNGTLVPPGGTFSFNRAIGEITGDKGYQVALVVSGDTVGRDVGGGVCQVSTTVFRAALNGGMPITEWYPHTYRLPNYERDGWGPGFDASILQWGPNPDEWPDFRFENYSDHWLLVESFISDYRVYVNIYGTGDGRSVEIDSWPIGGNAFGFTRVILDKQGDVIADRSFESHFK